MSLLSLLLIAPLVGQPAVRPPDSQALDTIAALEDLRAGTAQLEAFTAPPHSPSVRARAFLALGRGEMDGDRLGETFAAGLQDRDTDVRVMVAFAIGELDDPRHEGLLVRQVRLDPERTVVREIWKSLGRMGGQAAMAAAATSPPWYRPWAVRAAGLIARRLKREPWKVKVIADALGSKEPPVLAAGLYAVSRGRFEGGPAAIYTSVIAALAHSDADVRLQASRALMGKRFADARLADITPALLGGRLSPHAIAWMLRGWRGAGTPAEWAPIINHLATTVRTSLNSPAYHVLVAALQARGQLPGSPLRQVLAAWRARPQGATHHPAHLRRLARLECLDRFHEGCLNSAEGVRLGAAAGKLGLVARLVTRKGASPAVKMAALTALSAAWKKGHKATLKSRAKLLRGALAGPDGPVAAVAADIVAKQQLSALTPDVVAAQRRFGSNVEVAADLVRAVHSLGDAAAKRSVLAWAAGQRDNSLRRLARELESPKVIHRAATAPSPLDLTAHRRARKSKVVGAWLHTDLGRVAIRFDTHLAPLTVANLVALARKGYYDGVKFHRVVPGFVVQAGDPRGDGWGGPGHTIRCENNPTPYRIGAVGMALAGKDTGGSQWFIALTPQPHLLGTYTVFGQVVKGMEVVRRLAQGDVIKTIEIVSSEGRWSP